MVEIACTCFSMRPYIRLQCLNIVLYPLSINMPSDKVSQPILTINHFQMAKSLKYFRANVFQFKGGVVAISRVVIGAT